MNLLRFLTLHCVNSGGRKTASCDIGIFGYKNRTFLTMCSFFCYIIVIVNPSIGFMQEAYTNLGKEKDYVF